MKIWRFQRRAAEVTARYSWGYLRCNRRSEALKVLSLLCGNRRIVVLNILGYLERN